VIINKGIYELNGAQAYSKEAQTFGLGFFAVLTDSRFRCESLNEPCKLGGTIHEGE